ncbi:MAG: hypothetical protein ACFE0J_18895 [Elainellaceae cyanobacterium]
MLPEQTRRLPRNLQTYPLLPLLTHPPWLAPVLRHTVGTVTPHDRLLSKSVTK